MNVILAIAAVVIKELYRRKDFYVLFVLTAVITLLMGSASFFNDSGIVRYVKEICLLLIWISALVIAITTAARQIPAERENRTIFPLLAKPVSRAQVILGKFAGCWVVCGAVLLVFYAFLMVISGAKEHHWPVLNYFQALWMQWMMLAVVIALALAGSIVFAAPSSTATICFVIVLGIILVGGHFHQVAVQQPEPINSILSVIYFSIPHLEWFDLRDLVIHNQNLVRWRAIALATVYAAAYAAVFLFVSWLLFRRRGLN